MRVKQVQIWLEIRANPRQRYDGTWEEARWFCVQMERGLLRMKPGKRKALILAGMGYDSFLISRCLGISRTTVFRRLGTKR